MNWVSTVEWRNWWLDRTFWRNGMLVWRRGRRGKTQIVSDFTRLAHELWKMQTYCVVRTQQSNKDRIKTTFTIKSDIQPTTVIGPANRCLCACAHRYPTHRKTQIEESQKAHSINRLQGFVTPIKPPSKQRVNDRGARGKRCN